MSQEKLIQELSDLTNSLDNEVLTKGEIEVTISKIQILQSKLQTLQIKENTIGTKQIIENNKKTSKIARYLTIVTIILSIISLYNAIAHKEVNYTNEINKIDEVLNKQLKESSNLNKKVDALINKLDTIK